MVNELIIHVGDTKTGSTSIQQAMVRDAFEIDGKSYLFTARSTHNHLAHILRHGLPLEDHRHGFEHVTKALDESDADYGIISAENFQFVAPEVLHETIETFWPQYKDRVRLIAYVRPHPEKILSAYSEQVKLGDEFNDLDQYFDGTCQDGAFLYYPRFQKWQAVFGERLELRPFVRSHLYKQDVVSDFMHFVLGNGNFEITKPVNANTSLTVSQLALQREAQLILNEKLQHHGELRYTAARSQMGRVLAEYLRHGNLGTEDAKLLIPTHLVDPIQTFYAADAEAMDAAFFDGTPMSDALATMADKTVDAPQSLLATDHFSDETVEAFKMFGRMLGDIIRTRPIKTSEAISELHRHLG